MIGMKLEFEEALKLYKNNIYRVCKMFSSRYDEQKDLFQEISIQLYKSLPYFKAEASIRTFIYRIAINTCIRYKYKYQLGAKKQSIDDAEWFAVDESFMKLEQKEKFEQLYQCISYLKEADKSLVLLFLEDLSYKEMADITGISENLVAVKMSRVRERLFKCLTINPL